MQQKREAAERDSASDLQRKEALAQSQKQFEVSAAAVTGDGVTCDTACAEHAAPEADGQQGQHVLLGPQGDAACPRFALFFDDTGATGGDNRQGPHVAGCQKVKSKSMAVLVTAAVKIKSFSSACSWQGQGAQMRHHTLLQTAGTCAAAGESAGLHDGSKRGQRVLVLLVEGSGQRREDRLHFRQLVGAHLREVKVV